MTGFRLVENSFPFLTRFAFGTNSAFASFGIFGVLTLMCGGRNFGSVRPTDGTFTTRWLAFALVPLVGLAAEGIEGTVGRMTPGALLDAI